MSWQRETCAKGHAMTEANTYLRNGHESICRACQAEYTRQYRGRLRERQARGEVIVRATRASEHDRLMSNVTVTANGCWKWDGFVNKHGYGRTYFRGNRSTPAHQALYMLIVGPIPEGKVLDHTCHTDDATCSGGPTCPHRRCVNPAHLEPMTSEENSSRGVTGRRANCPKGHLYDDENTLVSNGRRYCRACQRAHSVIQTAKAAARKGAAE